MSVEAVAAQAFLFKTTQTSSTELAAGVPEGLGVKVGGVHPVGRRVDTGELSLVEVDEGCGLRHHHLVGLGLAQ